MTEDHRAHRAHPTDLLSRACVTCGEPTERFQDRFGEEWRHVAERPTAGVQQSASLSGTPLVCSICGQMAGPGLVVERSLAAVDSGIWSNRAPTKSATYLTMPRCVNRQACRDRLEAHRGTWPVIDATKATLPRAPASSAPAAEPDPLDAFG